MAEALARRIAAALVTLWAAATLAFWGLRLLPGDALTTQLLESGASASVIAERRAALGLDLPLMTQYAAYGWALLRGDLGSSLLSGLPVTELIGAQVWATLELAVGALVVSSSIGMMLGIAMTRRDRLGWLAQAAAALVLSVPVLWSGTLAVWWFSARLNLLPASGADGPEALILPAMVLGLSGAGAVAQVTAGALRGVEALSHVMTARAKGLRRRRVWSAHILRLALPPILTQIGIQAGFFVSGAVVTETLFARPGVGRLLLEAVLRQDYPLVQGMVVWSAAVVIGCTLAVDLLVRTVDPR